MIKISGAHQDPAATTTNGNPNIHLPKMPLEHRMLRVGYADNMRLPAC